MSGDYPVSWRRDAPRPRRGQPTNTTPTPQRLGRPSRSCYPWALLLMLMDKFPRRPPRVCPLQHRRSAARLPGSGARSGDPGPASGPEPRAAQSVGPSGLGWPVVVEARSYAPICLGLRASLDPLDPARPRPGLGSPPPRASPPSPTIPPRRRPPPRKGSKPPGPTRLSH